MDRDKLTSNLIRDEGCRLDAYRDSEGHWTIGVGHYIDDKSVAIPRMTRITMEEARVLLSLDIDIAVATYHQFVTADLDEVRMRALVNMTFNLGPRIGQFKNTLAAINTGDWEKAYDGMLASKWATQVKGRAIRLAVMIQTGKDPA